MRQAESAALKAVSSNKTGPFVREMSALYTPATLDAGDIETGGLASTSKTAEGDDQDDPSPSNFLLAVLDEVLPLGSLKPSFSNMFTPPPPPPPRAPALSDVPMSLCYVNLCHHQPIP